jgi:hypothetical protein
LCDLLSDCLQTIAFIIGAALALESCRAILSTTSDSQLHLLAVFVTVVVSAIPE